MPQPVKNPIAGPSPEELERMREMYASLNDEQREMLNQSEPPAREEVLDVEPAPPLPPPNPVPSPEEAHPPDPDLLKLSYRATLAGLGSQVAAMVPNLNYGSQDPNLPRNIQAAVSKAADLADSLSRALIAAQGETFR